MLQLLAQRRRARNCNFKRLKLVRNRRALGYQEVNWRHGEEKRDTVLCIVLKKLYKVEARHPVHGAAHVEWVDEVALDAGNVGRGQVRDSAIFKVRSRGLDPGLEHVAGDYGFGDEVAVGELDAYKVVSSTLVWRESGAYTFWQSCCA